jgi:signal transduction histidine kinase
MQQSRFHTKLDTDTKNTILTKGEKRNLLLITKESITNAVKYSDCTTITVHFKLDKGYKKLTIIDDGKGFDINCYTTGNGLSNIRSRAEQLAYKVVIQSSESGTTISLLKIS